MTRRSRNAVSLVIVLAMVCAANSGCGRAGGRARPAAPKNVILLIGDGMGFGHLKAGSLYASGKAGSLFLESLPCKAEVVTTPVAPADARPGQPVITDSAAAATALATGHKVYNGVLSVALPGDGSPYMTALESFAARGKKTGLVSTAYITDATPAAFGAHASGRGNRAEVVECYLKKTRPNVILGGGDSDPKANLTPAAIEAAGYRLVTDRKTLATLQVDAGNDHVFGLFSPGNMPYESQKTAAATQPALAHLLEAPSLSEMAGVALRLVSAEKKGFFLMVEGGLIDKAAHRNDAAMCLPEVVEFDKTVKLVMDWASRRNDTLVIVVADHETGGLNAAEGCGAGNLPEVTWATGDHTGANVPLYAWGVGADKVTGVLDNTDVYRLMMGTFRGTAAKPASCPEGATVPK